MTQNGKNPAVQVKKRRAGSTSDQFVELADGRTGKIVPVSAALIDEVTARIKEPPVPTLFDEDKGRDISNPNDPDYLADVIATTRKRGLAAIDAMVLFGLELVDGIPDDDDSWLKKLQLLERRGALDLSSFDTNDPDDLEFLYKRYIACDSFIIEQISGISGVSEEAVAEAEASFPGN